MNHIHKYILALTSLLLVGCKGFLDIDPKMTIKDDVVFNNEDAVEAYFVTLYQTSPIEDFNFSNKFNDAQTNGQISPSTWGAETKGQQRPDLSDTWAYAYKNIRNCNSMIAGVQNSSAFSDKQKKKYIAEARFLRGFAYFYLVKVWGGVPILSEPLEYTGDIEEVLLPRDQEEEVWDFIIDDFAYAEENLGTEKIYGRVNKYIAMAYKAKAALYAASAAGFGTQDLYHYVGVNPSRVTEYYDTCINASKRLIDSRQYDLFKAYDDPVTNFQMLFLTPRNNPEAMWVKAFDYNQKSTGHTHSWDFMVNPTQLAYNESQQMAPFVETAEAFEFADGREATQAVLGSLTEFKNLEDIFAGRDPRLYASIILPNDVVKGVKITVQSGIYDWDSQNREKKGNDRAQYYDTLAKKFVMVPNDFTVMATGASGGAGIRDCKTGLYVKKYLDIDRDRNLCNRGDSETDYIIMRYSEVLMNYVEACIMVRKNLDEALSIINMIKRRAGVAEFSSIDELTIARYKAERRSEFLFENQRFWDIRRWRDLQTFYSGVNAQNKRSAMAIFYDYRHKSYYVRKDISEGRSINKVSEYQYFPIPKLEIAKNPYLINNPGY